MACRPPCACVIHDLSKDETPPSSGGVAPRRELQMLSDLIEFV